jgi:hypothetical protein
MLPKALPSLAHARATPLRFNLSADALVTLALLRRVLVAEVLRFEQAPDIDLRVAEGRALLKCLRASLATLRA